VCGLDESLGMIQTKGQWMQDPGVCCDPSQQLSLLADREMAVVVEGQLPCSRGSLPSPSPVCEHTDMAT